MKKLDRLIFTFLYINIIILFSSTHLFWRIKIPFRSISYKSQQLIKMGLTYRLMQRLESLLKENQKKLNRLVFTFLCNNIIIQFFQCSPVLENENPFQINFLQKSTVDPQTLQKAKKQESKRIHPKHQKIEIDGFTQIPIKNQRKCLTISEPDFVNFNKFSLLKDEDDTLNQETLNDISPSEKLNSNIFVKNQTREPVLKKNLRSQKKNKSSKYSYPDN